LDLTTKSNDFLYITAAAGGDYTVATTGFFNGLGGADQIIFKEDDLTIGDDYFTNFLSFEVVKLANDLDEDFTGSSLTLGDQAFEAGIREVTGGNGWDFIDFEADYDGVSVKVNGGAGEDYITTAGGDDTINGGDGNDTINGGDGNDTINGGADNDTITGGAGADVLSGGTGTNTFVFASGSGNATDTVDEITDFLSGTNSIKTGAAATDGTNYSEISGADYGDAVTLAELVAAADAALFTSTYAGTQYVVVENGSTDFAAGGSAVPVATTASYLMIDWDGDNTIDQAILLTGVTAATISDSVIIV
jgi:Ca2+-binding RTX toxin-like protein